MKIKISVDGEGFILHLLKSIHLARFLFGLHIGNVFSLANMS